MRNKTPCQAEKRNFSSIQMNENSKSNDNSKNKGWFRIYNVLFDKYAQILGVYAVGVYMYILRCTNNELGLAWPSINTMSEKLCMSKNKVIESIKYLMFWNMVRKIITPRNKSNKYKKVNINEWKTLSVVHVEEYRKFKSEVHSVKSCSSPQGVQVVHEEESIKTKKIKTNYKEKENFDINSFKQEKNGTNKKNNLNITLRGKENSKTNTHPLEEKDDKHYMDEWRAMTSNDRWLHDLRASAFLERESNIRFNIYKETEELNALRVLAFKKQWKNEQNTTA